MKNLAIVIVNWNVRDLLAACLESLYTPAGDWDVWVVDNASRDGSVEMVQARFPQTHVIANSHNPGFAGGNNQALRALGLPHSPTIRYVLLLNPDTVIHGAAIATLIHFMESTPQAGVCGARLIYGDGSFQHSAFAFPGLAQIAFDFWPLHPRLLDSRINGRYPRRWYAGTQPFAVDHPLGAAMLVRATAITQVGLLDEEYHMYCEEVDWCWRIKRAGWGIYCVPAAEIVHYGGQSTQQARPEMIVALWRSRQRLYGKYYAALKQRLAAGLVRRGAQAAMRRASNPAVAEAYRQVMEMFA